MVNESNLKVVAGDCVNEWLAQQGLADPTNVVCEGACSNHREEYTGASVEDCYFESSFIECP